MYRIETRDMYGILYTFNLNFPKVISFVVFSIRRMSETTVQRSGLVICKLDGFTDNTLKSLGCRILLTQVINLCTAGGPLLVAIQQ